MIRRAALLVAALFGLAGGAWAQCTNPAGVAGHIIYSSTVNALQFCDGTNWWNLNTTSPTAPNVGCTNPAGVRGEIIFNTTQKTHQVCNGSQWADTSCGANVTAGSTCANPSGVAGQIIRATVSGTDALWSCGGASWARMGAPCAGLANVRPQDVFATSLYTGTGSTQPITNGLNLAGQGGLIWLKDRGAPQFHQLMDTIRGGTKFLQSNSTAAEGIEASRITSFNSNGFTLGSGASGDSNSSGQNYAAWSFRRAPRFFDVVTWTGNGTSNRQIAHNLGISPGLIIIKSRDVARDWIVFHRSRTDSPSSHLVLNSTSPEAIGDYLVPAVPTASTFTVASDARVNVSGENYVAYLFAHDTAADGVIQCGGYTGNGSTDGPTVTLGWQPQFLLIKNASSSGNWSIFDAARGLSSSSDPQLVPNAASAETAGFNFINVNPTGFALTTEGNSSTDQTGQTHIYCAIRAPM